MKDRIQIDPNICHGKPVIRGSSTPVTAVLGALASGDSYEDVESQYKITIEDIRACIAFANSELEQISYQPIPA
jgi:uncharacterized protein (DUF433 family)